MTDTPVSATRPVLDHPVLDTGVLGGFHVLEADAGTGKTWTIARLVLRALLETGLTIDQIVVVTFTKASAAELKARIAALLQAWSEGVPDDDDPFSVSYSTDLEQEQISRVVRQARLQLDDAPISTIHGFCQRVLTEQAMTLGHSGDIEPGFDDTALITEAVADWWRREIVNGPSERRHLIGRHGLALDRLVALMSQALSCPDAQIVSSADTDWTTLISRIQEQVDRIGSLLAGELPALTDWMGNPANLNQTSYRVSLLESRLEELRTWLSGFPLTIDEDRDCLTLFDPRRIKVKKGAPDARNQFGVLAAIAALNDLRIERSGLVASIGASIREEVSRNVDERKRLAQVVSFDDLLNRTQQALLDGESGAQLAGSLARRFPMALIDEFQDTDPAQWSIFSQIYQPGRTGEAETRDKTALVLVGDPKQAIYSFRNADVKTYLAARAAGARVHRLGENQRSSRLLVNAVNGLFDRTDPFGNDAIAFAPGDVGARGDLPERQPPDDGQGALSIVRLSGVGADSEPAAAPQLNARAAETCAHQIRLLLAGDPANGRAGEKPGDIAVLTRTIAQGTRIKDALDQIGVKAVEVSRDSVLLSPEADDLDRVLGAIASPRDDHLVRSALTTTLLGFDLHDLQSMGDAPDLWERRFQAFDRCQTNWSRQGPEASLRDLLFGDFERSAALVVMTQGERRLTNVLHLFEVLGGDENARQSAAQARSVLTRLREKAREGSGRDEATEVQLESDDQLVRILTIHSSKGLEFPIVFLPFQWADTASRAASLISSHVVDPDGGTRRVIVCKPSLALFSNASWGIAPDDPHSAARLSEQAAREDLEEGLRLNYVALTRASRRCVLYWGYRQLASKRGGAGPGDLSAPDTQKAGIGYLLDGESGLSDKAGADRVAARIEALAQTLPGVSSQSWHELLATSAPASAAAPGEGRRAGWPAAGEMQIREPVPTIDPAWMTTSFTGLMNTSKNAPGSGITQPAVRPDHDEGLSDTLLAESVGTSRDIRTRFDRGANAGSCLHDMLERIDYRQGVDLSVVGRALVRYGIEQPAEEVGQWLGEVLATPLAGADRAAVVQLDQVAPEDRIAELDYLLPVRHARASAIAEAVARAYPLIANLDDQCIEGYMVGFIDLIVRHEGRYYLLDWKSNWLSDDSSAYTGELMEQAIASHGYALQFCLYAVALQRWLRHCLADYSYDEHFGGVYYIFLRGAGVPGAVPGNGVYAARPEAALLDELDALLGLEEVADR